MKTLISALALTAAAAAFATPAAAQSKGDFTLGIGIANVNPKDNNGTLAGARATINDDTQLSLTGEYFVMDNVGIELLAATPFSHDIKLGGTYAGKTKHLPPTLSLNYHFPTASNFKPFLGIGVNYTTFFDEESPLGKLRLDDSWGVAFNAGADWMVSDAGAIRFDVRYMKISTDAKLDGAKIGTADIDPVVVGLGYVHLF